MAYGGGEPVCALPVVLRAQMKARPALTGSEFLMRYHPLGEKRDGYKDMRSSPLSEASAQSDGGQS